MKYLYSLIAAALAGATSFLTGCSENNQIKALSEKVIALEKASQSSQKTDVEARLLAVEKQLEANKKEIKTEKLIASSALFETGSLSDAKLEISPLSIYVTSGDVKNGKGSVAKLDSEELYINDSTSFRSAPYWSNGRGVRVGLEDRSGESPDVRIWHKDLENDKSLDFKLSESIKSRTEAWFENPARKAAKGFSVVDGIYGPILIEPVELKEIGSEGILALKIATVSAVPLSGLKAKLKYRFLEGEDKKRIGRENAVSFVIDKKMDAGVFYPVSIPLGVSKEKVGPYFTVEKVEVKGVFLRDAP